MQFYVIESRVSSNLTYNIQRPSAPEKELNEKQNTVGKVAKRQQVTRQMESLSVLRYRC